MGCGSSTKNVEETPQKEKEYVPTPEAAKLKSEADRHFDKKDYDKALDLYTQSSQADPQFGGALYNKACCLELKGQHAEAVKEFHKAGGLLRTTATIKKCHDGEERARKACPKDVPQGKCMIHKEKGDQHYDAKEWQEAVLEYTQAIAEDDTYASPWYNRGIAYEHMGKFTQAQESLTQAMKLLRKPESRQACQAAIDRVEELAKKGGGGGGGDGGSGGGSYGGGGSGGESYGGGTDTPSVILFVSAITSTTEQERDQRELADLLSAKAISYQTVDAAVSGNEKLSGDLRTASGGLKTFPQVFLRNGSAYKYVGDRAAIQKAVDEGNLATLLGMGAVGPTNNVEFILSQFKGSKIWKLTPKEAESLWYALDRKRDGWLDINEMKDFAQAFWEEQKKRGDERGEYLTESEAEDHTRAVRAGLKQHMDTDKDGRLEKDEFIKKWNTVAKEAFGDSETCTVM